MSKGKYYFSKSPEKGLKILALFNQDETALTYRLPDLSSNCRHNNALGKDYLSCMDLEQLRTKIAPVILAAKPYTPSPQNQLCLRNWNATGIRGMH